MPDSVGFPLSLSQGFRSDPFYHLSTYLCLSLVAAQFVLSCLVDQPPFFPEDPQQPVSCHASNPGPPLSLFLFWSWVLPMGQKGGSLEHKPLIMFHSAQCVLYIYSMPRVGQFF